ncbi:sensor histidine kinase [Propionibacteriaceae bacterium G57]|uniref:sensor histidine kinase n=1 Tax=Aestuariimicrobium sp. G57 TaxID=3418485 RepID=UPI003DA6E21D
MNFWLGLGIGLIVGFGTWAIVAGVRRSRARRATVARYGEVHPQLIAMIGMLKSGGMAVGPHDEVIQSNAAARSNGLVKGDRIAQPQVLELVRACRASATAATTDLELSRGAGAPVLHLTVRVAPLGGGVVVVLIEDRTPLLRVDETRRDFVANVSHELKTPIGAIALLAEAVGEAADDPEAVQHFAARLSKESNRLADLVSQIIELSRLQSSDPQIGRDLVPVADIVEAAIDRSRELAVQRHVSIATTGDVELEVECDPVRITDAVANLLQNGIVYSDEGSRVAISYRKVSDSGDDYVEIAVADNGIGIKPEEQQRIFERFYRVDYARSRRSGGTGLGLSIVKHIAAIHGGTVNVWSLPGQGSTFTLRLPYVTAEADERRGATVAPRG